MPDTSQAARTRWIALTGAVVILTGIAVGEDLGRRAAKRRFAEAERSRQQIQRQYDEVVREHELTKTELDLERERSQALSDALESMQAKMDETLDRLAEETRTVRTLHARMAAMQGQLDQLQGELSLALQEQKPRGGEAVKLERVVVSADGLGAPEGRVVSVHPDWNFIVINLGWDQVKIGETVSIYRDEELTAKARVERIQEGVCAATVLPEWKISDVQQNDRATIL
jgi:hypothetical protein